MTSEDVNMDWKLSSGCLKKLLNSGDSDELWQAGHTLQILSLKKVAGAREGNGPDRYRIIVSDGENYVQSMLATQQSHLVEDGQLQKNAIIRADKVTCNLVQGRRLLILLTVTPITRLTEKIGNPESLEGPGGQPTPNANGEATTPVASAAVTPSSHPRPAPQEQPKPRPAAKNARAVYPIEGLNSFQNTWTIKARCTQKSEIRNFTNQRGDGKLFNVTFMDESGEIRATGFNTEVDRLYDQLEEGKLYYVSKGRVALAKKKFSNLANDFEITFGRDTEIEVCADQDDGPKVQYHFIEISDLMSVAKDAYCDVIGIVTEFSDAQDFNSAKFNRMSKKRDLTLADRSGYSVRLTLWGKQAETYDAEDKAVLAFKGVRVGDFQGRTLSMVSSSMMAVNPDITEAHVLRGWYDSNGKDVQFKTHSGAGVVGGAGSSYSFKHDDIRTLVDVKGSSIGTGDSAEYFSCRATIVHIKADGVLYYTACSQCNKKLTEVSEGWHCEKCSQTFGEPDYRYMLSMSVADYSGQAWLSGFNDIGVKAFGMEASELHQLKERDQAAYTAAVKNATCKTYNFMCRARLDTYNETTRVRYGILRMLDLDFKAEAEHLRDALKSKWAN